MLDKLHIVKQRFDEVSDLIIQPDIIMDQKRYVRLNKEYKDLNAMVEKWKEMSANVLHSEMLANASTKPAEYPKSHMEWTVFSDAQEPSREEWQAHRERVRRMYQAQKAIAGQQ